MQSVQTTEQKQIPGEGGREMRQGRKEERGRREIWKDISLSVLHCSLTSQAKAPLSQLPELSTASSITFNTYISVAIPFKNLPPGYSEKNRSS